MNNARGNARCIPLEMFFVFIKSEGSIANSNTFVKLFRHLFSILLKYPYFISFILTLFVILF